ncbi:proteobacterial dedicated sortase system response regulator [Aestuariirhabdus litorea]|uniref:Proteobacterial dedicated sortase system response regulator n=1 Tax=Aestuariirhabdus litorea TaxID=2528527 RepID=A0A3P3VM92_9GAMM|nr:proteobacterial dedicated sortase system response regulator [Aestuariirhabdus litorea]RRJ83750.1 proteobacterial dedicated sortase system response regulator [Aestuariirhabdus litorea]RWW96973.1 proteobacterial dedicated sortase system response regulator [Endozoicomonadaceae bacterium GTF-13]
MGRRVALVEDDAAIRENYRAVLSRQGYRVEIYATRFDALAAFRQRLPELAVIDVGLGDEVEGGFDLCRELRTLAPQLPIIFLTARDDEIDAITGLRLGADDYLTKDISSAHIVARIVALFRRVDALRQLPEQTSRIECGSLELDGDCMEARWQGVAVKLTLTEFWLVDCLARHPGHVKNRQQLMDAANVVLDDNTITSNIKRIRRKFQQVDAGFNAIETVYGFGYRWIPGL